MPVKSPKESLPGKAPKTGGQSLANNKMSKARESKTPAALWMYGEEAAADANSAGTGTGGLQVESLYFSPMPTFRKSPHQRAYGHAHREDLERPNSSKAKESFAEQSVKKVLAVKGRNQDEDKSEEVQEIYRESVEKPNAFHKNLLLRLESGEVAAGRTPSNLPDWSIPEFRNRYSLSQKKKYWARKEYSITAPKKGAQTEGDRDEEEPVDSLLISDAYRLDGSVLLKNAAKLLIQSNKHQPAKPVLVNVEDTSKGRTDSNFSFKIPSTGVYRYEERRAALIKRGFNSDDVDEFLLGENWRNSVERHVSITESTSPPIAKLFHSSREPKKFVPIVDPFKSKDFRFPYDVLSSRAPGQLVRLKEKDRSKSRKRGSRKERQESKNRPVVPVPTPAVVPKIDYSKQYKFVEVPIMLKLNKVIKKRFKKKRGPRPIQMSPSPTFEFDSSMDRGILGTLHLYMAPKRYKSTKDLLQRRFKEVLAKEIEVIVSPIFHPIIFPRTKKLARKLKGSNKVETVENKDEDGQTSNNAVKEIPKLPGEGEDGPSVPEPTPIIKPSEEAKVEGKEAKTEGEKTKIEEVPAKNEKQEAKSKRIPKIKPQPIKTCLKSSQIEKMDSIEELKERIMNPRTPSIPKPKKRLRFKKVDVGKLIRKLDSQGAIRPSQCNIPGSDDRSERKRTLIPLLVPFNNRSNSQCTEDFLEFEVRQLSQEKVEEKAKEEETPPQAAAVPELEQLFPKFDNAPERNAYFKKKYAEIIDEPETFGIQDCRGSSVLLVPKDPKELTKLAEQIVGKSQKMSSSQSQQETKKETYQFISKTIPIKEIPDSVKALLRERERKKNEASPDLGKTSTQRIFKKTDEKIEAQIKLAQMQMEIKQFRMKKIREREEQARTERIMEQIRKY